MGDAVKKTETTRDVTPIRKGAGAGTVPARSQDWFSDVDRLFDSFFNRGALFPFRRELPAWSALPTLETKIPRVDVVERDNEILVRAELPGVEKDKVDVSLTDDSVTIKAETRTEQKEEKGNYYRCEITQGSYARTVALPALINTEQAKASFKDGLLELTLPKTEKAKRRSIKVE